ncbi:Inner membrane transport permease [termite gut metagenome]|uniref:Inner membrane transport permease n=1 Tax=termite gut metagenome TaxID=433724 RepID=A0A5J4Q3V9_9ZZZZ
MIKFLLEKEFKQLLRNSFLPKLIIGLPIMVLLVFPWVANQEIKDINLSVVDNDYSPCSRRLIQKITSSGYFRLTATPFSNKEALQGINSGEADMILEIQRDFERNLITEGVAKVLISANAVNGTKAGLGSSYLSAILQDYADELREESGVSPAGTATVPAIHIATYNKFNPYLDYKVFMIPAFMVMLLTIVTGFLPALNIVGEKESGTVEQINVTPVKKFTFIMAKLIPYWVIGLLILTICFLLAVLIYGLSPVGNIVTIYAFAAIYILVVSGLGLVISNYSNTMQQAMFVMFFFVIILILMSGLFTPVESMSDWAQIATIVNPLKYFIQVMRAVYLKGSEVGELTTQLIALAGFAVGLNAWAVMSYKKRE